MEQGPTEFDRYSARYARTVSDSIAFSGLQVDFFVRAKAGRLLELMRTHFGDARDLSLLDVGCGVGSYHPHLRQETGPIHGVDISADSIRIARENNPDVAYKTFDGSSLPYDRASFDVAYAICVLHHVPPPQRSAFLAEMVRVVRPGGLVVLFEHNPVNPATRYAVWKCPFDEDAVLLSRGESLALLREAGLARPSGNYMLALPATEGWMRRVDDALSGIPIGAQYYALGVRP
jgi:SAM-dependent methyltransferase